MDAPRTILSLSLIDGYTGRISNKKKRRHWNPLKNLE